MRLRPCAEAGRPRREPQRPSRMGTVAARRSWRRRAEPHAHRRDSLRRLMRSSMAFLPSAATTSKGLITHHPAKSTSCSAASSTASTSLGSPLGIQHRASPTSSLQTRAARFYWKKLSEDRRVGCKLAGSSGERLTPAWPTREHKANRRRSSGPVGDLLAQPRELRHEDRFQALPRRGRSPRRGSSRDRRRTAGVWRGDLERRLCRARGVAG